jgi:hypothetical protein
MAQGGGEVLEPAPGAPMCFTRVQSPESNGIVEAFVKTRLRLRQSLAGSGYCAPADPQLSMITTREPPFTDGSE